MRGPKFRMYLAVTVVAALRYWIFTFDSYTGSVFFMLRTRNFYHDQVACLFGSLALLTQKEKK